jgi:hypothetical protein
MGGGQPPDRLGQRPQPPLTIRNDRPTLGEQPSRRLIFRVAPAADLDAFSLTTTTDPAN